MADSTIPLKRCSRGDACLHPDGPWLPATLEYFPKHGSRLRSCCKNCHRRDASDWAKRNPDKANERAYRWERNNREQRNTIKRAWYHKNPEQKAARYAREREKRPEKSRTEQREWRAKKPWLYRLFWNLRMARKRSLPDTLTSQDWQATLRDWDYCCAVCGATSDITADHWIPLASPDCPGTTKNNMIPLCGSCNYSKHDYDAIAWMTWRFGRDFAIERYELISAYLAQF